MSDAIVETTAGKIAGEARDGLFIFRGIPYAAPPVGKKRWLPPAAVEPWGKIREAKQYAPVAPQIEAAQGLWQVVKGQTQSEDCLYLNIWTPGIDRRKRPVMVWIHGGGFVEGAGTQAGYRGHILATRGDAVIVTVNYRLGALGFLRLIEVTGGKIPSTGNEGLLDQTAALQWIKENIAVFGGDPENVTLFGESAGGMSIGCHLAMPISEGYFQRGILQSGAASTIQNRPAVDRIAEVFLDTLGVDPGDSEQLRAITTEQIIDAQKRFLNRVRTEKLGIIALPFQPVVDGKVIPENPLKAVREGASGDIPLIVGTTLDEYQFFMPPNDSLDNLSTSGLCELISSFVPGEMAAGMVEIYREARQARGVSTANKDIFSAIQTDHVFRIPAIRLSEAKQGKPQPAFHYLFTWPSPVNGGRLGACHAIDVGFTWGTHEAVFSGTGAAADALSRNVQDGWLALARSGKPDGEAPGEWPSYGEKRETMILGADCHIENDPLGAERQAWERIPDTVLGNF